MKKIFKMEYERATHSLGMVVSILMGLGFTLYKEIPYLLNFIEGNRITKEMGMHISFTKGSFYDIWFPAYIDGSTIYLFYFLGIMVALPYGISYLHDKKTGYIKNILNRVEKRTYLRGKYWATFLTGGIASVFPMILDFLVVRLILPIDCFEYINGSALNGITEWNVFIIEHPYVALVIIWLMWFTFGGALSTISLMVSAFSDNYFTVQLTPFFLMMLLFYLPGFVPNNYTKFFPYDNLTMFGQGNPFICFGEVILILAITYFFFVRGESRRDTL